MAATPSIRIIKQSPYKGGTKLWSNRYHFSGGTPADSGHWATLAGNVTDAEKLALSDQCEIIEAVCYAAGSDLPLFTFTYTKTGSLSAGGANQYSPLEVSALVRWSTDVRSSKNHPIYLMSYIRSALRNAASEFELLETAQATALLTYATAWVTGFSDGANTYHRAGPNGAVGASPEVDTYVTHRDFPR